MIDILSQYDEDQPVYIRNDNGYTYGSVQMDSVTEERRTRTNETSC